MKIFRTDVHVRVVPVTKAASTMAWFAFGVRPTRMTAGVVGELRWELHSPGAMAQGTLSFGRAALCDIGDTVLRWSRAEGGAA